MTNVGSLFVVLGLKASDYQNGLNKATKDANKAMNTIKREFDQLDLKRTVLAIAAVSTAFVYAEKKFADAANEAEKNKRRFEMVFGGMAAANDAWVDSYSKSVGRNKDDLQGFMATFDMMLKNMGIGEERAAGMSRNMAKLGVDIGSAFNVDELQVMDALSKAMAGQARGLLQYGIALRGVTETDANGNEVLSAKLSKMSNVQRAYTMYNALMEQTKNLQGDATRNAGDYGNQMKRLEGNIKTLKEEIGSHLLPVMTEYINKTNVWLQAAGTEKINRYFDTIVTGAEMAFGVYAVSKLITYSVHLAKIYEQLSILATIAGVGMAGVSAIGGAAVATAGGGYMMGRQVHAGTMTGFGPYGSGMPYGMGKIPNSPSVYDFQSGSLINNLENLGGGKSFDFQAGYNRQTLADDKDNVIKVTTEQQNQIREMTKAFEDAKTSLLRDENLKRLAEIDTYYKDESAKLKNNTEALSILEKVKDTKLEEYDKWWSEELIKGKNDRTKKLNEIRAAQMEKENSDNQRLLTLQGKGYLPRATEADLLEAKFEITKRFNEIQAKQMEEERNRLQTQTQAWLSFGDTIANTMMQAMISAGNSFNNIAKAFEGMLINMAAQWASKAIVFSALSFLLPSSMASKMPSALSFITGGLLNKPVSNSTDNSQIHIHYNDTGGAQKMIGLNDIQAAEQFNRLVRDGKIKIRKIA
jgi:hypothetical protein